MLQPSTSQNARALTLIELLSVTAIISVVLVLMLPAVLRTTETVRRSHCASNLKQLGVALAAYASTHKYFPAAGYEWDERPGFYSPHAMLLPYIGERELYNQINFDLFLADKHPDPLRFHRVAERPISVFQCPSDPNVKLHRAANNYRVCTGPYQWSIPEMNVGPFYWFGPLRPVDITDGLSSTAFMSERLVGDNSSKTYSVAGDVWYTGGPDLTLSDIGYYQKTCVLLATTAPPHDSDLGSNWLIGSSRYTWYNHVLAPNDHTPDCTRNQMSGQGEGAFTARSFHVTGVNLLVGDGSVRYVVNDVNGDVWRSVATRNNGEFIDWDSF